MSMAMAYAMKKRSKKMAEGGLVKEEKASGYEACPECAEGGCVTHGGDVVSRAMAKRMAKGGVVSNDDEDRDVEFEKDEFDDLEKDDHLEASEPGSNEHGEDEKLYGDEKDVVARAMKKRKDRMPRPA